MRRERGVPATAQTAGDHTWVVAGGEVLVVASAGDD
jgi:hypothetical protein